MKPHSSPCRTLKPRNFSSSIFRNFWGRWPCAGLDSCAVLSCSRLFTDIPKMMGLHAALKRTYWNTSEKWPFVEKSRANVQEDLEFWIRWDQKKEFFFGGGSITNQKKKHQGSCMEIRLFRIDAHQGKARRSLDLKNKRLPFWRNFVV